MQQYFSFINYATNKLTTNISCFQFIKYIEKKQYIVAKSGFIAAMDNPEKMLVLKNSQKNNGKIERITVKFREKSEIN